MSASVKNKVRLGTIFLFLLVVLSGGFSMYYLLKLRNESRNLLKANYDSLQYGHAMQIALDSIRDNRPGFIDSMERQLKLQEANITEPGETAATGDLRLSFNRLRDGDSSRANMAHINSSLQKILLVNMLAIKTKNENAETAAENASGVLVTIIVFIFIVGLTFTYNFPSVITTPIQKLTEAIREIGRKNYTHRVHVDSKDEMGELADAFNEMAERLEYFESSNLNKILFEKARAESVINSLKDASIGIDKNNIVLFANNQALQLLGMQARDIVGEPVNELAKRNDLLRFLLEEKGSIPFKVVVDNRENYFTKEVVDIAQDDGSSSRVIVLKNITTFKELDVAKTNFIATVSHELKTPLASSDLSLKLLEDNRIGQLSKEQKELIGQLRNDNQRMLRILSELLNMSQVEAGKIQLDIQSVSPWQIVENSMQAVTASAREKQLVMQRQIETDLPDIKADPDKISWVLNNFLTNAIKYAPSGSEVTTAVKKLNGKISFSVTDSGQGIEEPYLDRIFERYFQVPGRSDKKGSGIGLAISKEFIEAMGGSIWVKSRLGEGSSFGFDIPAGG